MRTYLQLNGKTSMMLHPDILITWAYHAKLCNIRRKDEW